MRKQAAKLKNVGINFGSDLMLTKTKQLNERAAKIEEAAKPALQALTLNAENGRFPPKLTIPAFGTKPTFEDHCLNKLHFL